LNPENQNSYLKVEKSHIIYCLLVLHCHSMDAENTSNVKGTSLNHFTITHLGTATVLLEIGSLRILTDPAFDPPGKWYNFGWGTGSKKLNKPVIPPESLGHIDCVLLSHDEHADNLDETGRSLLPSAGIVLTTASGKRRLSASPSSLANVEGLTVL
jgi:hypothetical protein